MKLRLGLLIIAALGFASFVYYRVQTLPQTPRLEIHFGQAGADGAPVQAIPPGKLKFIKGKVTHGPLTEEVNK